MTIDTIVYEEKNNEKKIALLGEGILKEIEFVDNSKAAEGNIYLGKVTKKIDLANGRQGFFLDIEDEHDGFLNAQEDGMEELTLNEGQSLIVQVSQERRAEKGARLTRNLQFVGNYIVYNPFQFGVHASSKITDKVALEEYKTLVKENITGQEGWLLRTTSVEVDFSEIEKEMNELRKKYEDVRVKARTAKSPSLLLEKPNPLFDYINKHYPDLNEVVINSHNVENEVKDKFGMDLPVNFSQNPFKDFLIDDAIIEALQKEVVLKNGGRVTVEETKAFVAIDVDSGKDTNTGPISRLNSEAAIEIARQIRLRNLAGKIIIDFAGSSEYKFLKPVIDVLEDELKKDYSKATCLGLSRAGNVEILRVRRRPTLQDLLSKECDTCHGTGRVEK
ncbi:MAG: ribonuclease E/G [Lactobacillus sp.]|jgi:ribonuclease G|nr:ribonuclease E/G [Lactobacillus sp.]